MAISGKKRKGRKIIDADDAFELREVLTSYGHSDDPDYGNTYLWNPQP